MSRFVSPHLREDAPFQIEKCLAHSCAGCSDPCSDEQPPYVGQDEAKPGVFDDPPPPLGVDEGPEVAVQARIATYTGVLDALPHCAEAFTGPYPPEEVEPEARRECDPSVDAYCMVPADPCDGCSDEQYEYCVVHGNDPAGYVCNGVYVPVAMTVAGAGADPNVGECEYIGCPNEGEFLMDEHGIVYCLCDEHDYMVDGDVI